MKEMKKILPLLFALLLGTSPALSQPTLKGVEASDIRLTRSGEYLDVAFTFTAGRRAVKANYALVATPVLRGGAGERTLTPIVVRGKRAQAFDETYTKGKPLLLAPGNALEYTASLPYESWMTGANIVLEGVSVGCCSSEEVRLGLLAEEILDAEPTVELKVVETPTLVTTGEKLAEQYPFIAPLAELEALETERPIDFGDGAVPVQDRVIAGAREGSLSVFFPQGSSRIDRNLGENNDNLVAMVSAVRALEASADSRIARVVVAGFASPEGSAALNERLAHDRAAAVKAFLVDNSEIDPSVVRIYNGVVDWTGLRELVAGSDLFQRRRVLEILDRTPAWDASRGIGRLGELRRLDGGEPYRYLSREFFPRLRQAAYIKVYFERK